MYITVKGGEEAVLAAHALQEQKRRGDGRLPKLSVDQIDDQLNLAADRVMTEGGTANRGLVALMLKQVGGDSVETIFLLCVYRTTLPWLTVSEPINTAETRLEHRISAVYKDIPGGQLLGPTYSYTHRLLDFTLLVSGEAPPVQQADGEAESTPYVFSLFTQQGSVEAEGDHSTLSGDITRIPSVYPRSCSSRLQQLVRGDEGYLLALAYSTQRGYGRNHPLVGKIRSGCVQAEIAPKELDSSVNIGELLLTEYEMVNDFVAPQDEPSYFTRGYDLTFGVSERRAMAVVPVDRALQAPDYDGEIAGSAQDEEFMLIYADSVETTGFVSHLRLPYYVDFQAELVLLKRLQWEDERS